MKKKNLSPQQAAPVQRETTTTSSVGEKSMAATSSNKHCVIPFAGDDAE